MTTSTGLGVSRMTAWWIFSNPEELQVFVAPHKETKRFAISLSRGPSDHYRPMLTGGAFEEREGAIEAIEWVLKTSITIGTEDLGAGPGSMTLERVATIVAALRAEAVPAPQTQTEGAT